MLFAEQVLSEPLQWAQIVAVPVILAVIGLVGSLVMKKVSETNQSAKEAADSVRPNGTGHKSLVHMSEDILVRLGEVRGEMKSFKEDFKAHADQDAANFNEVRNSMEDFHGLLNQLYGLQGPKQPRDDA